MLSTVGDDGVDARLAAAEELSVFKHDGFWCSMDTLRDKVHLEKLWNDGGTPWKSW